MSGFAFDANIVIDALRSRVEARSELQRAAESSGRLWLSRVAWIEVMSKGEPHELARMEKFLAGFDVDELDPEIARRAAALRRERPRLKSPDAIILASAQVRGRILVTRNTKDFPANIPGIRVPYTL
ncbi:MAG: PIN domain-containing protein [Sphingomonadales bacterium]